MTAKRPTKLKVRRGKRKLRGLKSANPKNAHWYVSTASRIGITGRASRDQVASDKADY